jgi:hypothetical protein
MTADNFSVGCGCTLLRPGAVSRAVEQKKALQAGQPNWAAASHTEYLFVP